jgi:hypothetical protein
MKKLISTLTCIAALVSPVLAGAADKTTLTFTQSSPSIDSFDFKIAQVGSFTATIGAVWEDFYVTKKNGKSPVYQNDSSFVWNLTDGTSRTPETGSFAGNDTSLMNSGFYSIVLDNLLGNTLYKLTLTGVWDPITINGTRDSNRAYKQFGGTVNLTSFNATVTSPVPEPKSYAMLLAGLCLVGTIANRHKSAQT